MHLKYQRLQYAVRKGLKFKVMCKIHKFSLKITNSDEDSLGNRETKLDSALKDSKTCKKKQKSSYL